MSLVDCSRGELKGGPNVLGRQLRVLRDDAIGGKSLCDQPDHGGDRDTRARDTRHTTHDPMIGHHAVSRHENSVSPGGSPIRSVDVLRLSGNFRVVVVVLLNGSSRVSKAHHGVWNIVAEITWLAFLAGCLALIITLVMWMVRARRRAAAPDHRR